MTDNLYSRLPLFLLEVNLDNGSDEIKLGQGKITHKRRLKVESEVEIF